MTKAVQDMRWDERYKTLKKLRNNSRSYKSFAIKAGLLHFVIMFSALIFSFKLIDKYHFALKVVAIVIIYQLIDSLINRILIYPRANLELQKMR